MSKKISEQLKDVSLGDLVCVEWYDASIGRSLAVGPKVDIPVLSWGVFIGLLGERSKHIILAQNSFRYTDGLYDVDYTSIPATWTMNVTVLSRGEVDGEVSKLLLKSFLEGRSRTIKKRTANHARVD